MLVTNEAQPVFYRVLSRTLPEAEEMIDELFELGAGADATLSKEEAEAMEETLNRHDRSLLSFLGIRVYNEKEVEQALEEYRTRKDLNK